jgi:hypothetical protein
VWKAQGGDHSLRFFSEAGAADASRLDMQGDAGGWGATDDRPGPGRPPGGMEGLGEGPGRPSALEATMVQRLLDELPKEIEILSRSGADSLRLSSSEAQRRGIEEAMGFDDGYFVLEMKVPLIRSAEHPHAVGIRPSLFAGGLPGKNRQEASLVALHFTIPKAKGGEGRLQDSRRGEGSSPDRPVWYMQDYPGGAGGGFPGGGRGPGMGRRGGPPDMQSPMNGLDVEFRMHLSTGTEGK